MLAARGAPRLGTVRTAWPQWQPLQQTWQAAPRPRYSPQRRARSTIGKDMLRTETPLAEQLSETGLWNYGRWAKAGKKRPKGDKNRVNIVSEGLCDDVLSYIPSLSRHRGCDILDIYPGAGLWSSRLHDALQPRSHMLLEPDEAVYRPFLSDLLAKPGTTLVPKSGIIWRDLSAVLDEDHLPYQREIPKVRSPAVDTSVPGSASDWTPPPIERNDTLLVTANLAFFPKRRFGMFESVTQLVLYQFINSIRASSLFHKYGLVRMLLWVESSDRNALLARSCQRRRRLAIDGELATDWITEIAGPDTESDSWFVRDHNLDLESCRQALVRTQADGVAVPPGRESALVKEVLALGPLAKAVDLSHGPRYVRPYQNELRDLERRFGAGEIAAKSPKHKRLLQLQYRSNREARQAEAVQALLEERDVLARAHGRAKTAKQKAAVETRVQAWNEEVGAMSSMDRKEFMLFRDNMHLYLQGSSAPKVSKATRITKSTKGTQSREPVLTWDRRQREPLVAADTEFFPNASCALLDVQPKAMHPLLRAMGPGTSRAGDTFELVMRAMMAMGAEPVSKAIESVWPGAAEGVLPQCPSLYDTKAGGCPVGGPYGELSARILNEQQWMEILAAWMQWPFRPTLGQLVSRISEDGDADPDDEAVFDY